MLSVPEFDNDLARFFVQNTIVKRDLFQAGPATHYCQQYSVHGKYQPYLHWHSQNTNTNTDCAMNIN